MLYRLFMWPELLSMVNMQLLEERTVCLTPAQVIAEILNGRIAHCSSVECRKRS